MNVGEDRIAEIAQRGVEDPSSLTLEEIREVGLYVLLKEHDVTGGIEPHKPNTN